MLKSSATRTLCAALLLSLPGLAAAQTCNPNIPLTKPDSRYTYNTASDEVTDTATGLIWKRCAEGMSWSGSTCTGAASNFNWEGGLAHAATQSGWRLPNLKELKSLVETVCYSQAINETAFPATPTYAWSASPSAAYTDSAWVVYFYDGYDGGISKNDNYPVRLVRSQ